MERDKKQVFCVKCGNELKNFPGKHGHPDCVDVYEKRTQELMKAFDDYE